MVYYQVPSDVGGYLFALLACACWGSWSNSAKGAAHIPFSCFYMDFAIGVFLSAFIFFLTLGNAYVASIGTILELTFVPIVQAVLW
jgi:hypothetical protein